MKGFGLQGTKQGHKFVFHEGERETVPECESEIVFFFFLARKRAKLEGAETFCKSESPEQLFKTDFGGFSGKATWRGSESAEIYTLR